MNVILDTDRTTLIVGEALATMRLFPDKSFDAIVTDPPFSRHVHANLGKERRNDGHNARDMLRFPPLDREQIAQLAKEFVRLSRGWITIFSDFFISAIWGDAIRAAHGDWVRTGHWVKTSPMPQMTGDRPACGAEDIVICHAEVESKHWEWNGHGRAAIWRGGHDRQGPLSDRVHPNQKPLWLMQSLLGLFVPKGGVVLDPFFGSGTTGVAALLPCLELGQQPEATTCKQCALKMQKESQPPLPDDVKVVGIEGDEHYAEIAKLRLEKQMQANAELEHNRKLEALDAASA